MATAKKTAAAPAKSYDGFTEEERDAMKERAKELKAKTRRGGAAKKADGEADVLEKIAELPEPERAMAERIHAIIKENAPSLTPKTWYGMPAYAKNDKVVVFFQSSAKFNSRYATIAFQDPANLDDGTMWPTAYALTELTPANEAKIAELVTQAAS